MDTTAPNTSVTSFWDCFIQYALDNPIVLTSTLLASVAIWGVITQRQISRRKSTFDYLTAINNNPQWIAAVDQFANSVEDGTLEMLANSGELTSGPARKIQHILNNYENVSVGIQYGVLDFKIVRDNWRSNIKYHWTKGQPFICKMRDGTNTSSLFTEFEALHNWMSNNKKPSLFKRIRYLLF